MSRLFNSKIKRSVGDDYGYDCSREQSSGNFSDAYKRADNRLYSSMHSCTEIPEKKSLRAASFGAQTLAARIHVPIIIHFPLGGLC